MSYRVELPVFSGPMDLLLHLVRQSEVDIHEISIARILDDYLKHLGVLHQLDLHDIGDFVVMASTLMEIKSRELLPNEAVELEQELDPRDDLIRRLLEYKRYRDLARELESRADKRSRQAPLVLSQPAQLEVEGDDNLLDIGEVGIWDLTSAFAKLLEEIGQQGKMEIEVEKRDVGYYTRRLLDRFRQRREVAFSDVFDKTEGRYALIGTLIALLEMMKQGYLRAFQERCFDEIQLAFRGSDEVTADQILAGITADEERERQRVAMAAEAAAGAEPGEDAEMAAFAAASLAASAAAADDDEDDFTSVAADDDEALADDTDATGPVAEAGA
ncbi:MAG: segregation/condensation protein A [Planctomycetes bacterium]|nr:segregation/condensation protein A [Planctomycetota bacterium]MCC7399773.1 segregation/condensation protein A [Planctomycetota bacterium]